MEGRLKPGGGLRRWRGVAVQIAGAAVGLALLGWCVGVALREENREQLKRLQEASLGEVAGLLALSCASLLFNGTVFWSLIWAAESRRGRRIGFWHVQAVNAVATCLAYVPFKLSLLYRFFVHRVRDGIPLGTIASWMAAAAAALVATCGPVLAAGLVLGGHASLAPVAAWSIAGCALVGGLGWIVARGLKGKEGLAVLVGAADRTRIRIVGRAARSRWFEHVHAGFYMVGDARGWPLALVGRLGDLGVQAARFWLAGRILGVEVEPTAAVLLALTYFTLGAASPSGSLGVRESGATGLAALLHLEGSKGYAGVTLLVTAADSIPTVVSAAAGLLAVRPWRLRRGGTAGPDAGEPKQG